MLELANIKDPAVLPWASAIVGAVAAKAVGGNDLTGASTTASETKNHYFSRTQEILKKEELEKTQDEIDVANAKRDRIDAVQEEVLDKATYLGTKFLSPQTIEKVAEAIIQWEDATADTPNNINVDSLKVALLVAGLNSEAVNSIVYSRMNTRKATIAAQYLGFKKTNYYSNGQPVYKQGNMYITPDVDSHNGGVWKAAGSVEDLGKKSTRLGTYDANLNRIGD